MSDENYRELTIERTFDAPPELVYKAWTDPELLAKWWGPKGVTSPVSEVDARVGGTIHIVMLAGPELGPMAGQRWPMKGTITDIKAGEKLVFKNNAVAEDGTILIEGLTTVTFEAQGNGTKMTLHVTAQGKVPQAPQMLAGMNQGWTESIEKLENLLASK